MAETQNGKGEMLKQSLPSCSGRWTSQCIPLQGNCCSTETMWR